MTELMILGLRRSRYTGDRGGILHGQGKKILRTQAVRRWQRLPPVVATFRGLRQDGQDTPSADVRRTVVPHQ